jgi:hypothetical protein
MAGPILTPNFHNRYGYWQGPNYSAGGASPSWLPYTIAQRNVGAIDLTDQNAKNHDLRDSDVQLQFVHDLASGTDLRIALQNFFYSTSTSDGQFVSDSNSNISQAYGWRYTAQHSGTVR